MKRLLLVDDEPVMTDFIGTVAQENNLFEIRVSNRADDFKAAFLEWNPDAVILDLAMPGTDGVELLRWLAESKCKARIAIISGFAEVLGERVTVLAETAERAGEINVERAEKAKKRAEERLAAAQNDPNVDWGRAAIALQRSLIRIQVARRQRSVAVPSA